METSLPFICYLLYEKHLCKDVLLEEMDMYNNKPIICIVGQSGAGKSTILDIITNDIRLYNHGIKVSNLVYCTTRAKRDGEVEGVDYIFYNKDELSYIPEEDYIEKRVYNTKNNGEAIYFTTVDNIQSAYHNGDIVVCAASVDQALAYYNKIPNVYFIILECSLAERMKRVINRDPSDIACIELCRRVENENIEFNKIYEVANENNSIKIDTEIDIKYVTAYAELFISEILDANK